MIFSFQMIIFFITLLFSPLVVSIETTMGTDLMVEPTLIDQDWEDWMIAAPSAIDFFSQIMVVSSKFDLSFRLYSPDFQFNRIKYPDSIRATLLQVSNGRSLLLSILNHICFRCLSLFSCCTYYNE